MANKQLNRELSELISLVQQDADAAESINDLVNAIQKVKQFDKPLKFDFKIYYLIAATIILIASVTLLYYVIGDNGDIPTLAIVSSSLLFVFTFGLGVYIFYKKSRIRHLSDTIFHKNLLFDNHLTQITIDDETLLAQQLEQRFTEFDRGNYSREIKQLYQGHYQGSEYAFDYHYYQFHYVDKRTVVSTDSKGKIQTKTVYDHYDRYGIYLPFNFTNNLKILSDKSVFFSKSRFKPASNYFNKRYTVMSDEELTAAKFLKPTVVLLLEQLSDQLKAVNLEFNAQAELCLSFADSDLLAEKRQYGIESPDQFIEEIKAINRLTKLEQVLATIGTLMTLSDNNFNRTQ